MDRKVGAKRTSTGRSAPVAGMHVFCREAFYKASRLLFYFKSLVTVTTLLTTACSPCDVYVRHIYENDEVKV